MDARGAQAVETEAVAGELVRHWLRTHGSGCRFASYLANGRVAFHAHRTLPPAADLDQAYDASGELRRCAITVLTSLRSERDLIAFLNSLSTGSPRWRIKERAPTVRDDAVLVGVEWTTATGNVCDVMGFAPSGAMPVTRRAPFVSLAVWPGERCNPFRGKIPSSQQRKVGFLDAYHELAQVEYDRRWHQTERDVTNMLLASPGDGEAKSYRNVAFALPRPWIDEIAFTP